MHSIENTLKRGLAATVVLAALVVSPPLTAQQAGVSWRRGFPGAQPSTGRAQAAAGDVDRDGNADWIAGASLAENNGTVPNRPIGLRAGMAIVYRGYDGGVLRAYLGDGADDRYGADVAGNADVDNDGVPDYSVSATASANGTAGGYIDVFSGQTGNRLYRIDSPTPDPAWRWGEEIEFMGDWSGDGVADLLVSEPRAFRSGFSSTGRVWIYDGRTGQALNGFLGRRAIGYATSMRGVGDLDGDGRDDFAVGATALTDPSGSVRGGVYVYSSRTRALARIVYGSQVGEGFGQSLAAVGDLTGDGIPDFTVGAPNRTSTSTTRGGGWALVSGADGTKVYDLVFNSAEANLGWAVDVAGDADNDGDLDLALGAPGYQNGQGAVVVVDATVGSTVLFSRFGEAAGDRFGHRVDLVADIDGSGIPQFAVGAPGNDTYQVDGGAHYTCYPPNTGSAPRTYLVGPSCRTSIGTWPQVSATGWPKLGASMSIGLRAGIPNGAAEFLLADMAPFPLDLGLIGVVGCELQLLTNGIALSVPVGPDGRAQVSGLLIPNDPRLVGLRLGVQWVLFDLARPGGVAVSNAVRLDFDR